MENHLNITNQFVPYELAVKLKELGFKENCIMYYDGKGVLVNYFNLSTTVSPLWQQAFDWFREKGYNAVIYQVGGGFWDWDIQDESQEEDEIIYDIPLAGSYKESRLVCLEKLIEIIDNEKPN